MSVKSDVRVGERVRIHPADDLFMRGVVYATVVSLGRKWVYVKNNANVVFRIRPCNVLPLD